MKFLVIISLLSVFKVNCFDSSEELVHESSDLNSFKSTKVNTIYVNQNKYNFKFFNEKNSKVFDCSITGQPEGRIDLEEIGDDLLKNTLVIRNCLNVTIECNGDKINSIIISKVSQVKFLSNIERYSHYYYSRVNPYFDIKATDVDLLILSKFDKGFESIGLNLKNVQLFELSNANFKVRHLKFDNVKIKNNDNSIIFIQNPNSILTVNNSHFGFDLLRFFEGKVRKAEFFNNTFEKINSGAFNLEANDSFVFFGNHVKILNESFKVISPNVTISHNTIQVAEGLLLPKGSTSHQILSFTENVIYKLSSNSFSDLEINFDSLHIANNHLFCSCQLVYLLDKYKNTLIGKLLLDKNKNFCINFEGCPIGNTIGRIPEVCENNFDCSKKVETKNQTSDVENYLQSILLTLQNIKSILSDKSLIKKEIESQTSQLQN